MGLIQFDKRWVRQPQFASVVDWSNPLTAGLVSLINPATGLELVSRSRVTENDSIVKSASKLGRTVAASANGGAAAIAGNATGVTTGPLTDFVFVDSAVIVGGSSFLYACGTYDGGSNGCGITIEHGTISNRWGAVDIGSNLTNSLASSGEQCPLDGGFLVHTRDGTTHRLYRNGVLKASVAGTSGNASSSAKFVACNLVATGGTFSTIAPIALAGRFNRKLSDSEVSQLSANPWQLFAPRRIWVPVSAASGAPTLAAIAASNLTASGARLTVT